MLHRRQNALLFPLKCLPQAKHCGILASFWTSMLHSGPCCSGAPVATTRTCCWRRRRLCSAACFFEPADGSESCC